MPTVSMHKDFVIKDRKAFEQLKNDVERIANLNRTIEVAPSLEKGKLKLKHFSFR